MIKYQLVETEKISENVGRPMKITCEMKPEIFAIQFSIWL